ncbi:MAG: monovalent cation:proton antiporter-2 (CPA2) family protein [Ostreibacterium sp.]
MTEGILQSAVVYLGAAVIVVPFVKRLKFSAVLGYLIAGIIIGPYMLGLVGQSAEEHIKVLHFAEFGVVMMLFLIGLELRPALLWQLRSSIIGIGGLQVLLTSMVLSLIALSFGQSFKAAIVIGMILALSSTAIVVQTLNEKGLLKTPAGKNIFSVLLFQDIAVIPMLAILPLFAISQYSENVPSLNKNSIISHYVPSVQVIIIIASIIGIVLVGRFVLNHILRVVAGTKVREIFTALALFIVVGISLLMQLLGLSPALGAFIAGVVLAESEYRHQLELDIEPFQGLLLGLFFMTIGADIDFQLLIEKPLIVILLVLLLVVVKFIILLIIARIFKMNLAKKMLFAFSLAQAGEFAFVLFAMAFQLNVLTDDIIALLTVVVALSMMLTPLLLILLDKIIMPRLLTKPERENDDINHESNPVIIAGYGRFGQMIGRLLNANGISATILDFNSDHVETVRRFGQKVYYGDASRLDLLKLAGAEEAKMLVITISDQQKSMQLVKAVQKTFPHLKIYVRAITRPHAYELMSQSVVFERDTRLSALALGQQIMVGLGYHPYRARRAAHLFRDHDEKVMQQLHSIYKENFHEYIESSKKNELIIAEILAADMAGKMDNDYGWSAILSDEDAEQVKEIKD